MGEFNGKLALLNGLNWLAFGEIADVHFLKFIA